MVPDSRPILGGDPLENGLRLSSHSPRFDGRGFDQHLGVESQGLREIRMASDGSGLHGHHRRELGEGRSQNGQGSRSFVPGHQPLGPNERYAQRKAPPLLIVGIRSHEFVEHGLGPIEVVGRFGLPPQQ